MAVLKVFVKVNLDVSSVEELDAALEAFLDAPVGSQLVQDVRGVRAAAITALKEEGLL